MRAHAGETAQGSAVQSPRAFAAAAIASEGAPEAPEDAATKGGAGALRGIACESCKVAPPRVAQVAVGE